MNFRLTDLPIIPSDNGLDKIGKAYTIERDRIRNKRNLQQFVERWRAIWGLSLRNEKLTIAEQQLIDGSFNVEAAWKCLTIYRSKNHLRHHRKNRIRKKYLKNQPHCGHTSPSCYGMHIMLPLNILHAFLFGRHYGVSVDIVFIQACGGFDELPGYGQPHQEDNLIEGVSYSF